MAMFSREAAQRIATRLKGEDNFTLAIADVESGGRSDLPDGRPQILFEAQWFHKFTKGYWDQTDPSVSSPTWNRSLYVGGAGEYDRLKRAEARDWIAARKSASIGLFQIMGFNYIRCGCPDVAAFWRWIEGPDDNDMEAFCRFIETDAALLAAYQQCNSYAFAEIYNGPGQPDYYSNKIDLSRARFAQGTDVHEVNDYSKMQEILGITVTGVWDHETLEAVRAFQASHHLAVDGIVGPMTRAAMGL